MNSAVFLSKVPNCKDTKNKAKDYPGPGYYDKAADQSLLSDHKRSMSETNNNTSVINKGANGNSNFLSTTKREDFWVNSITTPYTHPTNFENPGPGKYDHEKKKKDDIK